MTKYVYSAGDYSVIWDKNAFHVAMPCGGAAMVESSYPLTADGMGLAIARARYKGGDYLRQAYQHHVPRDDTKAYRRAEVQFCTEEGKRIFALGVRKAHAEWLDS